MVRLKLYQKIFNSANSIAFFGIQYIQIIIGVDYWWNNYVYTSEMVYFWVVSEGGVR